MRRVCEKGKDGQKRYNLSGNKINKSWDVMYSIGTSINSTVSKKDLKSSHPKKNKFVTLYGDACKLDLS